MDLAAENVSCRREHGKVFSTKFVLTQSETIAADSCTGEIRVFVQDADPAGGMTNT
ncbi:hypothetical protein [Thiolapillus sp.]